MSRWLFRIAILTALAGCSNGGPEATVTSALPEALVADDDAENDLHVLVHYVDPNGDLGGGRLRVVDCRRAGLVTTFDIPAIATKAAVEAGATIDGDLNVIVPDIAAEDVVAPEPAECADANAPPTAFCVVLVDASGVESAPACTGEIQVTATAGT
jgi:hypothetical protein